MELTNEFVAYFVGGQMEYPVRSSEPLFKRGEIAEIFVEDGELVVRCAWLALGTGRLPPRHWVGIEPPLYIIELDAYEARSAPFDGFAFVDNVGDMCWFYRRGHPANINPSIVEGLEPI